MALLIRMGNHKDPIFLLCGRWRQPLGSLEHISWLMTLLLIMLRLSRLKALKKSVQVNVTTVLHPLGCNGWSSRSWQGSEGEEIFITSCGGCMEFAISLNQVKQNSCCKLGTKQMVLGHNSLKRFCSCWCKYCGDMNSCGKSRNYFLKEETEKEAHWRVLPLRPSFVHDTTLLTREMVNMYKKNVLASSG